MKKWMSLLLVLALVCSLFGCGVQGEPTDGTQNMADEEMDVTMDLEERQQIEIPAYIQAAIDSSERLWGNRFFLAEDGSILVNPAYGGWHKEIREDLLAAAAVPNVKKLLMDGGDSEVLALTEEGDLYYNGTLIRSDVVDMDYNTITRTINDIPNNQFIKKTMAGAFVFPTAEDMEEIWYQRAMEQRPERFMDVKGQTVFRHEYNVSQYNNHSDTDGYACCEDPRYISAENRDYLVLGGDGKLYVYEDDLHDGACYTDMECRNWENLVWVDSAMYEHLAATRNELTLTVAGIQADGTVVACGEYADEILSWGPLSYLSMSEGLIAGLTTDGHARLTGQMARVLADEVNTWTDIAGIKVGKLYKAFNKDQVDVVSAVTTDGHFRVCFYDDYEGIMSRYFAVDDMGDVGFFRYSPDGNVYLPDMQTGEWEIWVPEAKE